VLVLEAGISDAQQPEDYRSYLAKYYTLGSLRGLPNGPYPVNHGALSPSESEGDPYFQQQGKQKFLSDYLRMLGGTTLHWQGTSLRMLPNDFRLQRTTSIR
jgi:choline dehydrogenase-like flavoprotein